ncbi:hypothetical protein RCC89_02475 [Cytophagaceae bacterium ABcell3]|nr:hypothetical protein RCC89_02475 [Cytophagaceae bacterium ABcell3]
MSRLLYIITIFFIPLISFGQQEAGKVQVQIKRLKDASIATDGEDNIAYVFRNKKQYQLTLMDKNFNTQKNYVINSPKFKRSEVIISTILQDNSVIVHLFDEKSHQFSRLHLNFSTGSHTFKPTGELHRSELFLSSFEMGEKFYVLTLPYGENTIRLYSSEGGKPFSIEDYHVEYEHLNQVLVKAYKQSDSKLPLQKVGFTLENNIRSVHSKNKVYAKDSIITLTMDQPDMTHLITINTQAKSHSYKKLKFSIEKGSLAPSKQGNSFIHNGTFFRLTASPEQLNISVINLDSMELINNYNVFPDEELDINNGPILVESVGGGFSGDEKVINKTPRFFKHLMSGEVAIAVNQIDSIHHEIQVGAYQETIIRTNPYHGGGMGMSFGFGGFAGPMMMGGGPAFYSPMGAGFGWPGYYPAYGHAQKRVRVVYFRSLMGNTYFDHQEGLVPKTLAQKIKDYELGAFRNRTPSHMNIFSLEDRTVLGYYVKGKSMYRLVEFIK